MANTVVLFDGVCNFCNGAVNFILRQDVKGVFRFAALQSPAGQRLLAKHGLPTKDFHTFILIENGRVYQQSTAALRLLGRLPWYWQWAQFFWLVPRFLRDAVYRLIARHRYQWFGKKQRCRLPTPEVSSRFLSNDGAASQG